MNDYPKAVAVTGASGFVGARLLRTLENQEGFSKLVAIDSRPPAAPVRNMAAYRADVTGPIDEILADHRVTTLVHLAFNFRRGRNRREIQANRQENLNGLNSVLEGCVKAQVDHVIYLSSHTVYGAHPDNPVPLTNDAPLRPLPDFPYGYDKFLAERTLREFSSQHQDKSVTILRSCIVLGPSTGNEVASGLFRRWLLGVSAFDPPMQFVYEDDLARVLTLFIRQGIPGTFNVAADGVVYYTELADTVGSTLFRLPAILAYPIAQATWDLKLQRESPSSGLALVRYPIIMSTARLQQVTGYRFRHTSLDALTAFANYRVADEELR